MRSLGPRVAQIEAFQLLSEPLVILTDDINDIRLNRWLLQKVMGNLCDWKSIHLPHISTTFSKLHSGRLCFLNLVSVNVGGAENSRRRVISPDLQQASNDTKWCNIWRVSNKHSVYLVKLKTRLFNVTEFNAPQSSPRPQGIRSGSNCFPVHYRTIN